MPILYVKRDDLLAIVEVERVEETVPEIDESGRRTGRDLELRYRPYDPTAEPSAAPEPEEEEKPKKRTLLRRKKNAEAEPEPEDEGWIYTTRTFLLREYRPLDGQHAKALATGGF